MARQFNTLPALAQSAALAALLALSPALSPAFAQDADAAGEAETAEAAESTEAAATDGPAVGATYTKTTHKDWQVRCVKADEGVKDPCTIYQLLEDAEGNAVAEITMFALPEGNEAAAGGSIIAPLETYLPAGVSLMIPGSEGKRYPFTFCNPIGCFARVGFTSAEVAAFKGGVSVPLQLRPLGAPDATVDLSVSLSGFTAAYDEVAAYNAAE
ncbi:invasion associated locus B family protein [Celeribacter sp.]|uniref:invasion associated locus B family protein n=1 Tax=Celeribacter sp. TaxID=1890673 RepID=UPI003A954F5A